MIQAHPGPALLVVALALLVGCDRQDADSAQGYIEGDFLLIAAEESARIAALPIAEGAHVEAGALLFRLDSRVEAAALVAAEARVAQTRAELEDLLRGARPERLAVLQAAVSRSEAEFELARKQDARNRELFERGTVPRARLDEAEAGFEAARARLAEARDELTLAALPERDDRIEAARAALDAARAEAERRRREIGRLAVHAPAAGLVQEVVRREGEVVPDGGTVVMLLPDDARRAVFFVPQDRLSAIGPGQEVGISCDGCPPALRAPVDFISREVEFTPPVIFGPEERERLLVRVEAAIPGDAAAALKPGQPITVTLPSRNSDDDA